MIPKVYVNKKLFSKHDYIKSQLNLNEKMSSFGFKGTMNLRKNHETYKNN